MLEFSLALAAFLASHVLPAATGLRQTLVDRLGRRAYLVLYSALSLGLLAWLISAAIRAPYIELWPPSPVTALAPLVVMPAALFLLISGLGRPNPLSVSFMSGLPDLTDPGALAITRHPALWGFALWAGAHAIANGNLVALILFGGMTAFSLIGMRALERRARAKLSLGEWIRAVSPSAGPPTVRMKRLPTTRVKLEILAALLAYGALLHLHPLLFGRDPLAWFR